NTVPVGIWIVGKRNVILVLEIYEPRHCIGTRWIHADSAVVIDSHECESGVDRRVRDSDIQVIDGVDWLPIRFGGSAEWINPKLQASAPNRVDIDDVPEVLDVGQNKIFLVCCVSFDGCGEWHAFDAGAVASQIVGAALNPSCYIGVSWTAVGRVIFEATVRRRVVRRRYNNAVGEMLLAVPVIHKDSSRYNRRRSEPIIALDDSLHVVAG